MKVFKKIEISQQEYHQKRYEISKEVLSGVITQEKLDSLGEVKQQESLIFNCINLADVLMKELGYFYKDASNPDETSVRNLNDLLKKD